jgi:hypothetical protein
MYLFQILHYLTPRPMCDMSAHKETCGTAINE